jgi:hypothetical protein
MKYLFIIFLTACGSNPYARNNYANINGYYQQIDANTKTPEGLAVDTSGFSVDLSAIDAKTDAVVSCLNNLYPGGNLPADVVAISNCTYENFDTTIHREWIKVKIATDWHYTPNGCPTLNEPAQQLFACGLAPGQLCEDKGLPPPTDMCPCCWRGIVQDQSNIITTPNLHLYDETLIRIITSCNVIWSTSLSSCYQP